MIYDSGYILQINICLFFVPFFICNQKKICYNNKMALCLHNVIHDVTIQQEYAFTANSVSKRSMYKQIQDGFLHATMKVLNSYFPIYYHRNEGA